MAAAPRTEAMAPPRSAGDRVRLVVRVVGELLVTAGVLLLLLVAYQLWWTNVEADRTQDALRDQITQSWDSDPLPPGPPPPPVVPEPAAGQGFAFMYIPRVRDSVWKAPVVQGVTLDDLVGAVGHYPQTQMPGQVGNFAVAAHRATNGELFADIDQLRKGDLVAVETSDYWYVYRLDRDRIVEPTAVDVVLPVPGRPGGVPTAKLLTLTTCNPRWASYERWIWWGTLVEQRSKTLGPPPGLGI